MAGFKPLSWASLLTRCDLRLDANETLRHGADSRCMSLRTEAQIPLPQKSGRHITVVT